MVHSIVEASRNIPVPDSVAFFRQERAAINLAHSSELEPSRRMVSLTWTPVICSKASRDSFACSACTGAAEEKTPEIKKKKKKKVKKLSKKH